MPSVNRLRGTSHVPPLSPASVTPSVFRSRGPELVAVTERVTELAARVGAGLSEQARLERRYAGPDGPSGVVVAFGRQTAGYAHLVFGADPAPGWDVELVGDPARPQAFPAVLAAVLAEAHRAGVAELRWWAPPSAAMVLLARGFGMDRHHDLHRMEAPLPAPAATRPPPAGGLRLRPLDLPTELETWLSLNRRAFATHPTQGRWTRADVERRMAQPWFEPDGLLVAEADGRLVATCWAKRQRDLGELYVVAVDPSQQGLGLGRVAAIAGLRHLAARGARTACLYVARTNAAALRLYAGLGFTTTGSQTVWRIGPGTACPEAEADPADG
jgi:mycothiol synthase